MHKEYTNTLFVIIYFWGCSGTKSTITAAIYDDCGAIGGMNEWQEKPKYSEKTCPIANLSTTDPT
jgi:hypothetical protein